MLYKLYPYRSIRNKSDPVIKMVKVNPDSSFESKQLQVRGRQHQGTKFWCQQKPLVTLVICYKFQKDLFEVWFYTIFFHDFIHVYSLRAVADNPLGMKFWCQQEYFVTSVICCKLKKNLFEIWFYTIFFMILYKYIARGQGHIAPWGQSFHANRNVLSLHSFVASFKTRGPVDL